MEDYAVFWPMVLYHKSCYQLIQNILHYYILTSGEELWLKVRPQWDRDKNEHI